MLDFDGKPAAGATFLLFRFGHILAKGKTNLRGQFNRDVGELVPAQLLVFAENSAPQLLEVSGEGGSHELRLGRGAVVSGRVTVDGEQPKQLLELTLQADRPFLPIEQILGLPIKEAGLDSEVATEVVVTTDADGSFSFNALPKEFSGAIEMPRRYRLQDPTLASDFMNRSFALAQPTEDLLIELTLPLRILGRVLEVEGGEPVPGAYVYPNLLYADGSKSRVDWDRVFADDDGRFEVLLENPYLAGTSLRVCPPSHLVERVIPIHAAHLTADLDLGDIPLRIDRGRLSLEVLVQDREGIAVPGAIAMILDAAPRPSMPTDELGRTTIAGLAEGATMVRVLAVGYEVEEVPALIGPEGGDLVVTLRRSTLLRLRYFSPDGSELKRVRCAITTSEYPFEKRMASPAQILWARMGTSGYTVITRGDGVTLKFFWVHEEQRTIVSGILPGLPMRVLAFDRFNNIVDERDLTPLLPEEHRDADIIIDRSPRTLRIRIVNEAGEPLAQARARYSYAGLDPTRGIAMSGSRGVDENGVYVFEEVFNESIDFAASCRGYIPFHDPSFEVPENEFQVEVTLLKGRAARVFLEDESGRPLDATVLARTPDDGFLMGRRIEAGQYLLEGLPRVAVKLAIKMGGASKTDRSTHSRILDGDKDEIRLVFPLNGRIEGKVIVPAGLDAGARCRVVLAPDDLRMGRRGASILFDGRSVIDFAFKNVPAGGYRLWVWRQDLSKVPEIAYEVLGTEVWVEVFPEETACVELSP